MNYKHIFHAGNFADVFKHCILLALVKSFFTKPKPMTYFETHAGSGYYALQSIAAQKTHEYQEGIGKLFSQSFEMPTIVNEYLQIIRHFNPDGLKFYPGSPLLVQQILRPGDKMVLCELHPEEHQALKSLFYGNAAVAVHHRDGYEALNALLPPDPRRGLVLIDPPFEKTDEINSLVTALQTALKKWPMATYAIWYPIKNTQEHVPLIRAVRSLTPNILNPALTTSTDTDATHLIGTGMLILQPPWQFDALLRELVPWLWAHLSPGNQGHFTPY